MPSLENHRYLLNERPKGDIVPNKTFREDVQPVPSKEDLKDGEILLQTLYLSLDPAMRGWLEDRRSYVPPVPLNGVMRSSNVCRVLASKSSKFQPGEIVQAFVGWAEYGVVKDNQPITKLADMPEGTKPHDLLSGIGMTTLTAYFGLEKIGQPKEGETVVVSGAAGATGSVVGQLAKLKGARVIGLAGSEEKCAWLKELGFDEALNYKDKDFRQNLEKATPNYIDVYWDNVGGEILEMALSRAADHSRFVMCGSISSYNALEPKGPRNLFKVTASRIRMEGFIVFDYAKEYAAAQKVVAQLFVDGKFKTRETIAKGGIKNVQETFLSLFSGANTGKLLLEVKNPQDDVPKL